MLNFGSVRFTKKHSDLPDSLILRPTPAAGHLFFFFGGGGDLRVSPPFFLRK